MPRLANPLQEAINQGVLWNPLSLRPEIFVNPNGIEGLNLDANGKVTSLKNFGTLGGTFNSPSVSGGLEPIPVQIFGRRYLYSLISTTGYDSSFSYNPIPSGTNTKTFIFLCAPLASNAFLSGLSRSTGVYFLAMNFGTFTTDFGVAIGAQSWIISASKQPLPAAQPTIISHRVTAGASGSASFLGRFSQGTSGTSEQNQLSGSVTASSTGATYLFGGSPGFTQVNRGFYGPLLVFPSALSLFNIQRVEGWIAWQYGCPTALSPGHPFKSRPPTN